MHEHLEPDDPPTPGNDPVEPRLSKREAQDELLIQYLIDGATQVEAGRLAGCSDRTVRRRFEDPTSSRRTTTAGEPRTMSLVAALPPSKARPWTPSATSWPTERRSGCVSPQHSRS